uniref:Uncharacterized protein n=1 Tax=Alexandrium andersonii TaxID=327968 RepID=A0A7S2C6A0_9DINO
MGADKDATLTNLAWTAWVKFSEDYKKDKEFEDQVKQTEAAMNEFLKKKKEDAKTVLDRMNGATDSGLTAMCIQAWYSLINDNKKARELEEKMMNSEGRFGALKMRQKGNAMNVQGRVNEQIKANLLYRCIQEWKIETRAALAVKGLGSKVDKKRQQLKGIEHLFKKFAQQLDEGLGNIEEQPDSTRRTKGLTKDPHTVSLPSIHDRHVH